MVKSRKVDFAGLLRYSVPGVGILAALIVSLDAARDLDRALLPLVVLMAGSAAAALAMPGSAGPRMIRCAPAFAVAAFVGLTPAAGVWVGLAALLVHPGALSGFASRRRPNALAGTAGLLAAWLAAGALQAGQLAPVLQAPAVYLVLAATSLVACWFLTGILENHPEEGDEYWGLDPAVPELLNVPLSWMLVSCLAPDPRIGPLLLVSGLIVVAAWVLRRFALIRGELQQAQDSLAARNGELATLHSVGREIVSSLDLNKVYLIVERECRKILDISRFTIALNDPADGRLERVYRHTRGGDGHGPGTVHRLEQRAAAERRGILAGSDFGGGAPDCMSAMAVPLIVEDRVIGVLMVRSVLPQAYDRHQLAVLTTIAQQAAVAIENARNYRMATVDSLTGASLRDYFFRRVAEEYQRASRYRGRFALLMLDLDRFKSINDRFGHQTGDRFLRRLGEAIRSILRTADLACRYGGDEFCILLPETGAEGAVAIAERLRGAVAALEIPVDGERVTTTASIGLAVFPDREAGDGSELLKWADQALYQAKRRGRNRVLLSGPDGLLKEVSRSRAPGEPIVRHAGGTAR